MMWKTDLKTQRRDWYFPPAGRFVDAIVPELTFLVSRVVSGFLVWC